MNELFSLAGAVTVGCLCLAAVALDLAGRLFFLTQHPDTSNDGAFGLGLLGCIVLAFAVIVVGIALHAGLHG